MDPLVSYFLTLSDEFLLTELFPRLPIDIIGKLCSVHSRFDTICQTDSLWRYLLKRNFEKLKKLLDTWRDTYMFWNLLVGPKASIKNRIDFIEPHLASRLTTNMTHDVIDEILDTYNSAIFAIKEPSHLLGCIGQNLKIINMDINCRELENAQPIEEEINSFFSIPIISNPSDENIFYHVISIYDPLTKQLDNLTSKNQLRILRPSENIGWRDPTCAEFMIYRLFLEKFKRSQTMSNNNST
jgi:hypothetical protein